MAQHNDLGNKGEHLASEFLIENGYKILHKNWRYKKSEIDIIAQKDNLLIAIEVKTRSSAYFGNPETFVNAKKIKSYVLALDAYIQKNDIALEARFDIIAIIYQKGIPKIEHLKDAFLYF